MATYTKNLNLVKPDLDDDADIMIINDNMDIIDEALSGSGGDTESKIEKAIDDHNWDISEEVHPFIGGEVVLYIDSENGDDTADGMSEGSPLASFEKAYQRYKRCNNVTLRLSGDFSYQDIKLNGIPYLTIEGFGAVRLPNLKIQGVGRLSIRGNYCYGSYRDSPITIEANDDTLVLEGCSSVALIDIGLMPNGYNALKVSQGRAYIQRVNVVDAYVAFDFSECNASVENCDITGNIGDCVVYLDHANVNIVDTIMSQYPNPVKKKGYSVVTWQAEGMDDLKNLEIASQLSFKDDVGKLDFKADRPSQVGYGNITVNGMNDNSSMLQIKSNAKSPLVRHSVNGGTSWTDVGYVPLEINGTTADQNGVMNIPTGDIVASSIGNGGYIKYSNGLIIQWGIGATGGTTNFPISFTTGNPLIVANSRASTNFTTPVNPVEISLTAFKGYGPTSGTPFSFIALGR